MLDGSSSILTSGAYMAQKKKTLSAGTKEHRMAANELSRDQLLQQLENVPNLLFEKDEKKKKTTR
jgi:hypothetical protein